MNDAQVKKLAAEFANMLRIEIGSRNFATMKKRNSKNKDRNEAGGTCHSHDFCDANMVMYAAFQKVTGRETVHSKEDLALWNAAWNVAFTKYFS